MTVLGLFLLALLAGFLLFLFSGMVLSLFVVIVVALLGYSRIDACLAASQRSS